MASTGCQSFLGLQKDTSGTGACPRVSGVSGMTSKRDAVGGASLTGVDLDISGIEGVASPEAATC